MKEQRIKNWMRKAFREGRVNELPEWVIKKLSEGTFSTTKDFSQDSKPASDISKESFGAFVTKLKGIYEQE